MKLNNTESIFKDLKKTFLLKGVDLSKVYIAGGSLLDPDNPNDIDLYCEDMSTIVLVEDALTIISRANSKTTQASTFTVDAYSCPIQVIKILKGKPQEVVEQFDFEQNSCFMRFSDTKITSTNDSNDLKVCKFTKTPNTMLFRLVKMLGKGYSIKKCELDKLLKMVSDFYKDTPDDWNLLRKDLGSFYEEKRK
jgi:hypothetical protein